jgi:ribosomal protein S18 acetylase RimI-like enzyme
VLTYRRASSADVATIVALVESAYRGEASRQGWTTEADLLDGQRTDADEVAELVADPAGRIVVAEEDGQIVGSVLVSGDGGPGVYIGMFAVRPGLQGRGVGRALLAEAERVGRDELGKSFAHMTVLVQRHELIAWYQRRGYHRTGESVAFPYGDPRSGLPRRSDLVFEVLRKELRPPREG